jgi:hypothetical protein
MLGMQLPGPDNECGKMDEAQDFASPGEPPRKVVFHSITLKTFS